MKLKPGAIVYFTDRAAVGRSPLEQLARAAAPHPWAGKPLRVKEVLRGGEIIAERSGHCYHLTSDQYECPT